METLVHGHGPPLRILVTGSRTLVSDAQIDQWLHFYTHLCNHAAPAELRGGVALPIIVIFGDAKSGADAMTKRWVERRRSALGCGWGNLIVGKECKMADHGGDPLTRDRAMVAQEHPDITIACIRRCEKPFQAGRPCRDRFGKVYADRHGTHGSTYTARLALEAGSVVHVLREEW